MESSATLHGPGIIIRCGGGGRIFLNSDFMIYTSKLITITRNGSLFHTHVILLLTLNIHCVIIQNQSLLLYYVYGADLMYHSLVK